MKPNPQKDEEEERVRHYVELQMGLPIPDGWFLECCKRTWNQLGVLERRIVGIWGYRSEILLKIRKTYESRRHTGFMFWDAILMDWPEGLRYFWLVRTQSRLIPLAEAIKLERRYAPS